MTNSTEEKLFQEVSANPDDDEPRLVMADWYDEAGDPRGEFIRAQCEMEKLDWDDERYIELEDTVDQMLPKYRAKWVKQLPKLSGITWGNYSSVMSNHKWDGDRAYFRRGFVELLTIDDLKSLKKNLTAIKKYGIASFPTINNTHAKCHELLIQLGSIRGLSFSRPGEGNDFRLIRELKSKDKLQALAISEFSLDAESLPLLTDINLPNLNALDLHYNSLGDSLQALYEWSCTKQIKWLNIGLNGLGGDAPASTMTHIREFAKQDALANLFGLDLWGNSLQGKHMRAFTKYATMTRLIYLSLSRNPILDEGVEVLAKGKFRSLRFLNLSNTQITNEAVQAIAASAKMASLRRLNIGHNSQVGDKAPIAIADSKHLTGLTHLNLAGTEFGEAGAKALIDNDSLQSVRFLNIGGNILKETTLKALQRRYPRAVVKKPYH